MESVLEVWQEIEQLRRALSLPLPSVEADVTPLEIQTCERELGVAIPKPLKELLPRVAGQTAVWSQPETAQDVDQDGFDFGDVSFFSPADIAEVWASYRESGERGEYSETLGPVRATRSPEKRIPFAGDVGAGVFWIDLDPEKGGQPGQVIWTLDEGDTARVVASNLAEFLLWGLACLKFEFGLIERPPRVPFDYRKVGAVPDTKLDGATGKLTAEMAALLEELKEVGKRRQQNRLVLRHGDVRFGQASTPDKIEAFEKKLGRQLSHEYRALLRVVGASSNVWAYDVSRFPSGELLAPGHRAVFGLWGIQGASESLRWDAQSRADLRGSLRSKGIEFARDAELVLIGAAQSGIALSVSFFQECFGSKRLDQSPVFAIGVVAPNGPFGKTTSVARVESKSLLDFLCEGVLLAKTESSAS